MKTKKELVLATYKDYVRHFGVKLGARKWKESKKEKALKRTVEIASNVLKEEKPIVKDLEPIQQAVIGGPIADIRKSKGDIMNCGASMVELIRMPIWHRWIKPQIQKDAVDFVMKATMSSGEVRDEAMGGYKYAQKILRTINKWVQDFTYLMREEEKKQNASRI